MKMTSECMMNYFAALETRNPQAVATLFHESGFVIWGDRIWRGNREIQEFYAEILDKILVPEMEYETIHDAIEGEVAYMVWSGSCTSHEVSLGVGNFVVKDNAIYCLTLFMEGNF